MTRRQHLNLVDHVRLPQGEVPSNAPVTNIIVKAKTERGRWIEESTSAVGDWRATFRSTYIRWALCVNGLHVAAERYRSDDWQRRQKEFVVRSLRMNPERGGMDQAVIAAWDGHTAAKNHLAVLPMLNAYGIIDLYACLEDWIFSFYRSFLSRHPDSLLKGEQFRDLRQLRRLAADEPAQQREWDQRWQERLDAWQRKRVYDGLDRVFLAFFADAGLKKPKAYQSDEKSWAESIRLIAVLRNSLIHGAQQVDAELASLCGKPHSIGFDFKDGDPINLELKHLQAVECFTDQLLTAVNVSLAEHPDAGR